MSSMTTELSECRCNHPVEQRVLRGNTRQTMTVFFHAPLDSGNTASNSYEAGVLADTPSHPPRCFHTRLESRWQNRNDHAAHPFMASTWSRHAISFSRTMSEIELQPAAENSIMARLASETFLIMLVSLRTVVI